MKQDFSTDRKLNRHVDTSIITYDNAHDNTCTARNGIQKHTERRPNKKIRTYKNVQLRDTKLKRFILSKTSGHIIGTVAEIQTVT